MYQLVAERLTGQREESYSNDIMAEGVEREAKSRLAYEIIMGCEVNQVGCVYPNEKRRYLCSPDGLVGTPEPTYGLELKNVLGKTQVKYLLEGELPTKYIPQVQGSMLVTGLKRWDFMSYSPGMPPLIVEVKRDEEYISKLSEELDRFCSELEELAREIDNKMNFKQRRIPYEGKYSSRLF